MPLKPQVGFLGIILLLVLSCDLSPIEETELYPATIQALDSTELLELNRIYQKKNNDYICSTLNEFGFTGFSRVLFVDGKSPCDTKTIPKIELPYSDELLDRAREAIVFNSEFTNVRNSWQLVLKEVLPLYDCTICEEPLINSVITQWRFTFENQTKDNIEVYDTEISVYVDALGVNRIWGNWHEIYAPDFIEVGYVTAKEKLIGKTLSYEDENGEVIQQEITATDLGENPYKKYVPAVNNNTLQLHLCWVIEISLHSTDEVKWKEFVDVKSGEIVKNN
ncbi:MAG: hypothetical protein WC967_07670 [Balneolaceae bacterium]